MFDIGKKDDPTSPGGTPPPKPDELPKPGASPTPGGPQEPPLGGPLPAKPTPSPVSTPPIGGPKPFGGEPTLKEVMAELKDIKGILAKIEAKGGG